MGVYETVIMGSLDVLGLWRMNKPFGIGVQTIQLGFFIYLPGVFKVVCACVRLSVMSV
jgi:hypothetical protein